MGFSSVKFVICYKDTYEYMMDNCIEKMFSETESGHLHGSIHYLNNYVINLISYINFDRHRPNSFTCVYCAYTSANNAPAT